MYQSQIMNAVQKLSGKVLKLSYAWAIFISFIGCPRFLRTDLGTENSTIAFLQPLMQHQLNISGYIWTVHYESGI